MKRVPLISIVFCITVISFLIFTADSFSAATVVKYEGDLEGLEFTFDPALKVTLPGLGEIVVAHVEIIAKGKEHIVFIPLKKYNYDAKFEGSTSDGYDFIVDDGGGGVPQPQPIKLISGSLNEHFIPGPGFDPIDPAKDIVPKDVDLFFKSTLSTKDEYGNVYTFSLDLKLKHGQVQFK